MSDGTKERWLPPNSLPTRRWLLAAALLVAEYVVALLVFDSERMPIAEDTTSFAIIGESMPLIIVVMTATLLIGGGPSKAEMTEIAAAFRQRRRTWPFFVGHLLAYALAIGITIFVFNPGLELERPWLWVALWAASAVCSFFLLVAAVVPKAALRPLAKPAARALAVGLVVGLLAHAGWFRHLSALAPDEPTDSRGRRLFAGTHRSRGRQHSRGPRHRHADL